MAFALKTACPTVAAKASRKTAVVCRAGKYDEELVKTAKTIATPGRGILAMDESNATCGKRLDSIGVENTEDNRRAYRELLLSAPGLGKYVSGAILFEETLFQNTKSGKSMVAVLNEQGIAPGIKVDEGLVPLEGGLEGETWTKGLENLAAAAREYKAQGAEFAKWRATIKVQQGGPSDKAIERNAEDLASYAAICQVSGLVPIVEPEILIDGHHDIGRFQAVTERVIAETFTHMWRKGVHLEGALLKPQMVIPGADYAGGKATPEEVAHHTVTALRRVVPPALPGILFLSGGQSEEEATLNLNAINVAARQMGRAPWSLSFSYGRALQHSVLKTWAANQAAVADAQAMALALAEANSRAALGNYSGPHPTTASTESLRENFRGWSGAAPAH